MTLDRSYIGYLGFLGIDLFKSVLMYSNGAICLIKLLFKMGLFTVFLFKSPIDFVPAYFVHVQFVPNLQYNTTVVRHVTGNDKDYLRKIPRVVW